jgi:predicted nucleic acid-binding protein
VSQPAEATATLTDAGPLIALIDADEPDHERCRAALESIRLPLLTTWPAFTEAMYLLGRAGGDVAQQALWRLVLRGDMQIAAPSAQVLERIAALMKKYADRPMDLADASLVALAEERRLTRIFTLDADFHIYRMKSGRALRVVPE